MRYRRAKISGGTYFITFVTHQRRRLLSTLEEVGLLREAFRVVMARYPFVVDAVVVLPDHVHCLLTMPGDDIDYPLRIRLIKSWFSKKKCVDDFHDTPSLRAKKEKGVWQRRYWEHTITSENDYTNHVEYIHYNPVKHGLAAAPREWPWSSFHNYVRNGMYDVNWGAGDDLAFADDVGAE